MNPVVSQVYLEEKMRVNRKMKLKLYIVNIHHSLEESLITATTCKVRNEIQELLELTVHTNSSFAMRLRYSPVVSPPNKVVYEPHFSNYNIICT